MDEGQRERVAVILAEALALPRERRPEHVRRACAADAAIEEFVRGVLAAVEGAADEVSRPTEPRPLDEAAPTQVPPAEGPGTVIGRYRLLQQIGEGGFGTVFLAEQREPVVRRVALKIIKLGMDTRQVIARFEAERQALAMMDHPNIAKVLDAGATDAGRPYFVMELVRGDPITEYCDTNNLDVRQRLELFQQVCHAVQHAHQKGIIHRDIKPRNVLVTVADGRPIPKVIDFGIAKATSGRLTEKTLFTEHRALIGTPEYMSPEQAEMSGVDIDTRSDIYSLGVLLYELLTGTTPFDPKELRLAAFGEIQRIIREVEPLKPSTRLSGMKQTLASIAAHRRTEPTRLPGLVRGDLDWSVRRCLEKDRTRRYETANGLALDVQRHLAGEAVAAAPPGAAYRLRKFARRHRRPVIAGSALALTLVLGLVGTTLGFVQAEARRRDAERSETVARDEQAAARAAEAEATRLRDDARLHAYYASLGAAELALRSGDTRAAQQSLAEAPETLRNWEWRHLKAATDGSLRVLRGHSGPLAGACLSADGMRALTWSQDRTARVWDVRTGRSIATLEDQPTAPLPGGQKGMGFATAAFSPDGGRIATRSSGGIIRLWDAEDGELILSVTHPGSPPRSGFRFDPKGRRLLAITSEVELWNTITGEEAGRLSTGESSLRFAAFTPDGARVVAYTWNGRVITYDSATLEYIRESSIPNAAYSEFVLSAAGDHLMTIDSSGVEVWDTVTGVAFADPGGHEDDVVARALSPGRARVCLAYTDGSARLWDAGTGALAASLAGHRGQIQALTFSPDGARLLTTSYDDTARVWDCDTGVQLAVLPGEAYLFDRATFSPDGDRLLAPNWSGDSVPIWDAETGRRIGILRGHEGPVTAIGFSADGLLMVTASTDGTARLWNADTPGEPAVRQIADGAPRGARFVSHGAAVVAWSPERGARVWNATDSSRDRAAPPPLPGVLWEPEVSRDGRRIVFQTRGRGAVLWDSANAKEIGALAQGAERNDGVAFSPDGSSLLAWSKDGTVRVFDSEQGRCTAPLRGHTRPVNYARFSPDGRVALTASRDNTVRLWDASSGAERLTLRGRDGWCASAEFSPDGSRVLTAGTWYLHHANRDSSAHLWDAQSGGELRVFRGHRDHVFGARFSRDGSRVLTWSIDCTARVWNGATGDELVVLRGLSAPVSEAAFSPDARRVVTRSHDPALCLWDASTGLEIMRVDGRHYFSFNPDGSRILTWSDSPSVQVWDSAIGRRLVALTGHSGGCRHAEFSPAGDMVLTLANGERPGGGEETGLIRVWHTAPDRQRRSATDPR